MSNAAETSVPTNKGTTGRDDGSSGFNQDIVDACETVVEEYRRGEVTKVDAVLRLYRALQLHEVVEAEEVNERDRAYRTYFSMLEEIDHDQRPTNPQGAGISSSRIRSHTHESAPHQDQRAQGDGDERLATEQRSELGADEERRSLLERLSEPTAPKRRRIEDGDDSGDESSRNERRTRTRHTIDDSLFPFVPSARAEIEHLSDDLQRTLVLKENYTRDLAFAKQSVVCSPACPPIPDAVWTDVLANRYVDLDRIFSAVYTVDGDSKSTVKLGDYELTGLPSKPERRIERHGHWTIAWALYQRAVLYVYPHRERELRTYYDQINGFFAAVSEAEASRIINLDRAIRGEVGRSNTLLLSDFSRFNHLYTMHVVGAGAATQSSSASQASPKRIGSGRRPGPSSEACIRFNEGRCTSRSCRFRHVCSSCAARDHVASACSQKTAGGSAADRRK
ncbi:hypothetical protein BN946_scf184600.g20 [Trametes cinnabarina]|uniref:C3H1-type domain-containing protein n=1 Tax=Pycnoporus cinnabarinus TaxID=5643 RepID=A0A060SQM5_PYCCI|nr:hypothetical protein BN946_scf184600.g20 [Trametes cinnabarina]